MLLEELADRLSFVCGEIVEDDEDSRSAPGDEGHGCLRLCANFAPDISSTPRCGASP